MNIISIEKQECHLTFTSILNDTYNWEMLFIIKPHIIKTILCLKKCNSNNYIVWHEYLFDYKFKLRGLRVAL